MRDRDFCWWGSVPVSMNGACEPARTLGRKMGIVATVMAAPVPSTAAASKIRVMKKVLKVAWVSTATEGEIVAARIARPDEEGTAY